MFKTSELNTILNPKQLTVGTNGGLELMTGPQVAIGFTLDLVDTHITGQSSVDFARLIDRIEIRGNDDYVDISGPSLFAACQASGNLTVAVEKNNSGNVVPIGELDDGSTDYFAEVDVGAVATEVTICGILPIQFGSKELPKIKIVWAAESTYSETVANSAVTGTMEFTQFYGKEPKVRTYFRETYEDGLATGSTKTETLPVVQGSNLDCVGVHVKSEIATGGGGVLYNIDDWKMNIKNGANKVMELEDSMMCCIRNWLGDNNPKGQGCYTTVGNVPSSTNLLLEFKNNTGATVDLWVWYMFRKGA